MANQMIRLSRVHALAAKHLGSRREVGEHAQAFSTLHAPTSRDRGARDEKLARFHRLKQTGTLKG